MVVQKIDNQNSPLEYITDMASMDASKVDPLNKIDPVVAREKEEKEAIKRSISPYWSGKDTIASYNEIAHKTPDSVPVDNQQNNTKKTTVPPNIRDYYRDTLESMEKSKAEAIENAKAAKSPELESPYYQSSIGPAIKPEQIQPSLLSDEEDTKVFMSAMNEFIAEAQEAEKAGEINVEALIADIFRMQIDFQEESSGLSKAQLLTAKSERKKVNEERLKKMDEILDRARTTKMYDRISMVSTGLQLAASAVGLSTGWGVVAFILIAGNTALQVFSEQAKSGVESAAEKVGLSKDTGGWVFTGLQVGLSICSSLFSVGAKTVALGGNLIEGTITAVKGMAAFAQGTSTGFGGLNTYWTNRNHGDMMKMTDEVTQKDSKMKSCVKDIQELVEKQNSLWKTMRENVKKSGDTTQFIFAQ